MSEQKCADSIVMINTRREVSVGGIKSILGFGDDYVILDTECGRLEIEGEEMKIEGLSKDEGVVNIRGKINSLYYSEPKNIKSLFSKKNK